VKSDHEASGVAVRAGLGPELATAWLILAHVDPDTQEAGTSVLRVHAESTSAEPVGREFSNIMIELALASLPGFTASSSPPQPGRAFGFYKAGYLPQADVPHVVVLADGTRIDIPPPTSVVEKPAGLEAALCLRRAPPSPWLTQGTR